MDTAAKWLTGFLNTVMPDPKFMNNTLVVVTFDEDDNTVANHIFTILLGPLVPKHAVNDSPYNHFSLLRTVEDNFGVGNLGRRDANAVPIALNGTYSHTLPAEAVHLTPVLLFASLILYFTL